MNLNKEHYWEYCIRGRSLYTVIALFVRVAHARHIRFRSRSPRSHVKPLAVVCVSPKRQVSRALNTPPIALWSTIRTHHEGGNTWAIGRTYNGYTARRSLSSPVSCMPSLNLNVYALRGGDAARYNAPTSDASDIATCSRWYSNLDGKTMPGEIAPMMQYPSFVKEITSLLSELREELVAQIGIFFETCIYLRRSRLRRYYWIVGNLGDLGS